MVPSDLSSSTVRYILIFFSDALSSVFLAHFRILATTAFPGAYVQVLAVVWASSDALHFSNQFQSSDHMSPTEF